MQLGFTTLSGEFISLDLADNMSLQDVKALCELDLHIPVNSMLLSVNGRTLPNGNISLSAAGLKNGDMVLVANSSLLSQGASASASRPPAQATDSNARKMPKIDFSSIAVPGSSSQSPRTVNPTTNSSGITSADITAARQTVEGIKKLMQADPNRLDELRERYPQIVEAAMRDDYTAVAEVMLKEKMENLRLQRLLIENPDSPEAQAYMMDRIKQQRIQENFEYAIEHLPESLASVHMLYVNCTLNGQKMKAFVDSGAQTSIISREYARLCNLEGLVDERFQGMAVGVGNQKIVGKVHACTLEIGGAHIAVSLSVLESDNMQILLGLDMMRRHQMIIDLKQNRLVIGTTGSHAEFLHESELPEKAFGQKKGNQYEPNDSDVQELVNMGFAREKAREALIKFAGNKEGAVAHLTSTAGQSSSK